VSERSKRGRIDRNSDARRGRSHRFNSVRGVGCKEQEKTWTVVWGPNPQQGQRGGYGSVRSSKLRIEGATETSCERVVMQGLREFAFSGAICGKAV